VAIVKTKAQTPITALDISNLARNQLQRAGVRTVEQLEKVSLHDLLGYRQIGSKTAAAILQALSVYRRGK
jgi:DNA-directed RNA polymerase alpha subunit